MKIGIYTPYLDTMTGGERYILKIVSCLATEHDMAIFWNDASILLKAVERFNLSIDTLHVVKNIFTPTVSFAERFLASRKYDVIIVLSDGSIPLLASKKTILHFQFPVEWANVTMMTKFKFSRISKIVCNSAFTKEYIDRKFGINSSVIYPPVTSITPKKKENIILTVGRFSILPSGQDFKKQAFLIDTFKTMVDNGLKQWAFHIITNCLEAEKEQFVIFKKQTQGYPIYIHTDVSQKELHEFYSSAAIYWHAAGYGEDLQKHPEYAEHFGISTVEAMSAGAIPVVINAGGQTEIVTYGVNGLLWNNSDELQDETMRLIEDKKLRKRLVSDPKILEEKFGEERFCREINKLIQ